MAYSINELAEQLRACGIVPGDILLVHSAFRNIHANSPAEVIEAIEKVISFEGTLVMPSWMGGSEFFIAMNGTVFDTRNHPGSCGVIPETFRKMPGVIRSLSPGHCCAARGKLAEQLMADHEKCRVSAGWGSPFEKIINLHGKILLIGCGNGNNTTLHYVENTHGAPTVSTMEFYPSVIDSSGRRIVVPTLPHMPGLPREYSKVDDILEAEGIQKRAKFGDAELRVIDAFKMNELIGSKIEKDRCCLIKKFSLEDQQPAANIL